MMIIYIHMATASTFSIALIMTAACQFIKNAKVARFIEFRECACYLRDDAFILIINFTPPSDDNNIDIL